MKTIAKFLLIIICFVIFGCSSKSKKISMTLFNVENLNNISVHSFDDTNLNSQGYNRIVVDMLVYEQKINDTIVQLEIDMDYGFIRTKNWKIKLSNNNEPDLKNYIQSNYGVSIFDSYTSYDNESNTYSFPAIKDAKNDLFLCHISKEHDNYYLNVIYYNPIRK
ncbi:hypothetical protein [Tenacibaculum finnmarkense]|uniref:hypothetical protein n=1 Tax=Tenacibaculum finnmarkense TaxID=2781243 RepID=UPI001E52DBB3|nr:hypothetical protein [Tenacibaculum finnmarkense]MCD8413414.1 hypothetical protein [Tenacibaculum finnmarkense genomovar ulcerans]